VDRALRVKATAPQRIMYEDQSFADGGVIDVAAMAYSTGQVGVGTTATATFTTGRGDDDYRFRLRRISLCWCQLQAARKWGCTPSASGVDGETLTVAANGLDFVLNRIDWLGLNASATPPVFSSPLAAFHDVPDGVLSLLPPEKSSSRGPS
jgi:hypothetical protein